MAFVYTRLQSFEKATLPERLRKGVRVVTVNIQEPVPGIDTNIHLHPNRLHIGYCESGMGFFHYGEEIHRFRPGFVYVLYPGIPHRFRATRKNPYCAYFVHVEVSGAVVRELPEIIPVLHRRHRIESLIRRMYRTYRNASSSTRDLRVLGLLAELYAELMELAESTPGKNAQISRKTSTAKTPADAFKKMLEQFQMPPFKFPGIDALAAEAAMSRRSFTLLFRNMTGYAPYELFNRLRIQHAQELLASGELNVSEVAACCGYSIAQSFIRAYKAHFGVSPRRHYKKSK